MAGKYGSTSVTVSYDDGPGGTLRDMTQYVLTMSGIKREAMTQQTNPFGIAYEAHTPTGVVKVPDITVGGIFDTTATTGPHVVFGSPDTSPQAATRTLVVVFGDGKTATMESRLVSYEVIGKDGNLTEYQAVIRQAGDLVWS